MDRNFIQWIMHPICFWSNWGQILLILYASLEWTLVLQIVHYWAAHEGIGQLRNKKQLLSMSRKDKMADGSPRRLACPTPPSVGPIFTGRGRVISGPPLEWSTQNYWANEPPLYGSLVFLNLAVVITSTCQRRNKLANYCSLS